jgi:hypothetical protein
MSTPLTREQQIIKSFIEGRPDPFDVANALAVPNRLRAPRHDPVTTGRFGFKLSPETAERLEKRKGVEGEVAKARAERGGSEVDKEALRRDILGSDRARKLRAQTRFQSQNSASKPYVKVADRK